MDRQDAISQFMEASRLMQSGNYSDSLLLFNELRTELAEFPALFYNIAIIQEQLGYPELAEVEIINAMKLDDNNSKYLKVYYKILQQKGQFEDAVSVASHILAIEYDPEIKLNKCFLYLRMDEPQKAIQTMDELLKEGSHYPVLYFTLGVLKYQSKQYLEAEMLLKEALKFEYQPEESLRILIAALDQQGKNVEAIDLLENHKYKTENSDFSLAKLYKQKQDYELALSKVDELLENNANNIDYLNFKGHTLREMSKFQKAVEIYNQVLFIDRQNLSAIKGKALSLVELGQYDEANKLFELGEQLNRDDSLPTFDNLVFDLDVLD